MSGRSGGDADRGWERPGDARVLLAPEPVETLVERVRAEVRLIVTSEGPTPALDELSLGRIDAALTELVERLQAAVDPEDYKIMEEFWIAARERAEAAERERDESLEAGQLMYDKFRDAQARVAELEERLQGAGNAQDLAHFKYAELQARVAALEEALREGGCQFYIDGAIGACQEQGEDNPCAACAALRVEGDEGSDKVGAGA